MTTHPLLSEASGRIASSAIRELLRDGQRPDIISLAAGLPDPTLMDIDGLTEATQRVHRNKAQQALQYGLTEGQTALRSALSRLLADRGVDFPAEHLLVTTGSQQGLDLLARALINPGDTVLVEAPTYLAALQAFKLAGARIIGIPGDSQGMCVEQLERLAPDGAKLLYVVPEFANPTGATLSLPRRRTLLDWASRHGIAVIEDDPYGPLRFSGETLPSLLALSRDIPGATDLVCQISSLSKIVAPGLRLGWLAAPDWLRPALIRIKQTVDLHSSTLTQEIAAAYLDSGRLHSALERQRIVYRRRRDVLCEALDTHFSQMIRYNRPEGGMFVWARIQDIADMPAQLAVARDHGVVFVPGDVFYPTQPESGWMRLGFASVDAEHLHHGVARLANAFERQINGRNCLHVSI